MGVGTGAVASVVDVMATGDRERQSLAPSNTPPPPAATIKASSPTTGTCTAKNILELPLGNAAAPDGAGIWIAGIGAEVVRVAA